MLRLRAIRSLTMGLPVDLVHVSPLDGSIVVVCRKKKSLNSTVTLFGINGDQIGRVELDLQVCSVFCTAGMQGVAPNHVVCGTRCGQLLFLDACDLSIVAQAKGLNDSPLIAVTAQSHMRCLVTASHDGAVLEWTCRERGRPPPASVLSKTRSSVDLLEAAAEPEQQQAPQEAQRTVSFPRMLKQASVAEFFKRML
jgi:hypothetical protein